MKNRKGGQWKNYKKERKVALGKDTTKALPPTTDVTIAIAPFIVFNKKI